MCLKMTCSFALMVAILQLTCVRTSARPKGLTNGKSERPDKFRSVSRQDECETSTFVSSVCYHCGELYGEQGFAVVFQPCCEKDGEIRQHCISWYTEEPKRGNW